MKDFNKQVIQNLKNRGVIIVGTTFVPDKNGDFLNGETAYRIIDNGVSKIRSYLEVLEMANEK